MTRKILILLSVLFVLFSFTPTLLEIYNAKLLPPNREFTLEHNYMFDYNFYLSRIREGQEGRWTVVEKYYNMPHSGSLFQIFYLFFRKDRSIGIFRSCSNISSIPYSSWFTIIIMYWVLYPEIIP